jgi:hypothetical protein
MAKEKNLELVATNGSQIVRLVWFRIGSEGGIYGSVFHPSVKLHRSYHRDGRIHWKADGPMENVGEADKIFKDSGYSHDVVSGAPLDSFTGHFSFLQGIFRLDPDCFDRRVPYEFGAVDRLLIVDSRAIKGEQRFVNFYLDLVEIGSYQILGARMAEHQRIFANAEMICEHHCYLEFEPWVLVSLAYSTR